MPPCSRSWTRGSDPPGPRRARDAIVEVTDQPVRFLVSSTYHGPFTGGNAVYRDAVAAVDLPRYRRFQGYSRAMEMAVRRWYRELTVGLD